MKPGIFSEFSLQLGLKSIGRPAIGETAAQPGTSWSLATLPSGLAIGPNSIVVTNDGTHSIFVGAMWAAGIWKYVEP